MPNGEERNWIRLCGAIDGFRSRYKCWPTRLRLSSIIYRDLKFILTEQSFIKLENKLSIIIDDSSTFICAEDDKGRTYNYVIEGFPRLSPDLQAEQWLDIGFDGLTV